MNNLKLSYASIAVITALGLSACGGGGSSAVVSAASTPNLTVGVISGFGSVFVNGCEYETNSASIYVEGQSSTEDALSVGDVVQVNGATNCTSAQATQINSADELEGWVDSVALTSGVGTMVVMGQKVTVTEMTIFDDDSASSPALTINDLVANNIVEIHGFSSDQGTILATRIEVKAASLAGYLGDLELKGVVQNHNTTASTFNIGALGIDYSSIAPGFDIADGLLVEVKFDTNKNPISIEIEDDGKLGYNGEDDEEMEINGVLTLSQLNNEFMVGEQKIQVTDTTEYKEMDEIHQTTLQAELANTARVGKLYLKVAGKFVNGVLVAKQVEFEDNIADNKKCTGTVSALAATAGEINTGTFTVTPSSTAECENQSTMDVTVNNSTIMEDDSVAKVDKFNLTYLNDGDVVEVYTEPTTGAAIKLKRK